MLHALPNNNNAEKKKTILIMAKSLKQNKRMMMANKSGPREHRNIRIHKLNGI